MFHTALLTNHKNEQIIKKLDRIGSSSIFNNVDDLKEFLYDNTCEIIILDEEFVNRNIISDIKSITLSKSKLIGFINYENIHKSQFGIDDFILNPVNPVLLEHRITLLNRTINNNIVPNHNFDNQIIFECIDKLNRIQMNLELNMPKPHIDFLIKNIEWNLRLLELFHVSIKINIPYFQMLIKLTEDLMKYFSTQIKIHIEDDITMYKNSMLQELIVKIICLCRFATQFEKVVIVIQNEKIFTNIIKKFSNTFSSRLLNFALDHFTMLEIVFNHNFKQITNN